jgi:aspartyl-tRNA(Asn)/glutamyl-tRNA(Gln) amidotransferase subunit B
MGLALNCNIDDGIYFDRKHYFYPDLPKGYQISQYKRPICSNGKVELSNSTVEIERIHQEEDVAKSTHHIESGTGLTYSLIDYNKSGVPLIEIVTKPCIRSAKEAKEYATRIRQIARYLNISDADMEKGQMRCEPNISIQEKGKWEYVDGMIKPIGDYKLNSKVEVKNIGSITAVEKSVEYEFKRLVEALENGEEIVQQTRGWNADRGITEFQRSKETADDYRYMAEPDIPVIDITKEDIDRISEELVELPSVKFEKYQKDENLTPYQSGILISDPIFAESFEEFKDYLKEKTSIPETATGPTAANFITGTTFAYTNATGTDYSEIKKRLPEFTGIVEAKENKEITQNKMEEIYTKSMDGNLDPEDLLEEAKKQKLENSSDLNNIINQVIEENKPAVDDYQSGKKSSLGFLIGQVMQRTQGTADPNEARSILMEELEK